MGKSKLLSVLTLVLILGTVINLPNATAITCVAPNPEGPITACNYTSQGPLIISDGLPPGSTIETEILLLDLSGITISPGGGLGGQMEKANAILDMTLAGTGFFTGYNRFIQMPVSLEAHTGPRTLSDPVQVFNTDMFSLLGQIPPGDPDFDLLRIVAGTNFGLPSPGHTTLTQVGPHNWTVDSFFDITYRIDFVGSPGGPFAGMSGSTGGTVRIVPHSSADSDLDGIPDAEDPEPNDPCVPNPSSNACVGSPVGGTLIPIDTTSLLLAGTQMNTAWLIPVIVTAIGFTIVAFRKF